MNLFISSLSKLTNLNHLVLNLANQHVQENSIRYVSELIQSLQKLETLTFESSNTDISAIEFNYLLSSIGNHSNISNLNFKAMNYSSSDECLAVFKHLEQAKQLKYLNFLINNNFKMYSGVFIYQEYKKININLKNFLVDENEIQSLSLFIQNMNQLESFYYESDKSNLTSKQLSFLFSSFQDLSKIQNVEFKISETNSLQEEYLLLFKYLGQNNQLKNLKFFLNSGIYNNNNSYANIEYEQNESQFFLGLIDIQIDENNAQYLSLFIKRLKDLQKLRINLNNCVIQSSQLNTLFNFFQDHQSINQLNLKLSNQKVTSEQLQAIIQSLKQSQTLKQLELELSKTQLEKQVNEVLSDQLSQLKNIISLKHMVLFDNIDISTSFIDNIVKNESLQELYILFYHLEQDGDYQLKTQKLLSMPSLKKLMLHFLLSNGREIEFFKDLNCIKQTNLQQLTIVLQNYTENEFQREQYTNLGKYLSNQKLIKSIIIKINENDDFESCVLLLNELKSSNMTSFKFEFLSSNMLRYINRLDILHLYLKRKMKRVVNLEFS
ncbi:hypothetical protein ABPG72_017656 [Tetrahymena utriculariae]